MLGRETIPIGETEATRRVVEASRALLATDERPVRRQQHAKHHGCVRAEFVVEPGLPDDLRVGLFREPRSFPAWVRFSNGRADDDREKDAHGMAVKVMGVDGPKLLDSDRDATTHDFVLVDNPTFFLRDVAEYVEFSGAMLRALGEEPSVIRFALGFLPDPLRSGLTLVLSHLPFRVDTLSRLRRFTNKRPADPLNARYWSTTPYLFGEGRAVKYSAVPLVPDPGTGPPAGASANYLREAMAAQLSKSGAEFDFKVQFQADERSTPIEDPTVLWDESVSPPRTLARIKIPAQEFMSTERMTFCEHLSFTPWHALPEHRPLGGINRARKGVYIALSWLRHDLNGVASREPQPGDRP